MLIIVIINALCQLKETQKDTEVEHFKKERYLYKTQKNKPEKIVKTFAKNVKIIPQSVQKQNNIIKTSSTTSVKNNNHDNRDGTTYHDRSYYRNHYWYDYPYDYPYYFPLYSYPYFTYPYIPHQNIATPVFIESPNTPQSSVISDYKIKDENLESETPNINILPVFYFIKFIFGKQSTENPNTLSYIVIKSANNPYLTLVKYSPSITNNFWRIIPTETKDIFKIEYSGVNTKKMYLQKLNNGLSLQESYSNIMDDENILWKILLDHDTGLLTIQHASTDLYICLDETPTLKTTNLCKIKAIAM